MTLSWIDFILRCIQAKRRQRFLILSQDLEEEREVNKDEVLEYCNSTDVNIPLIETSAKVWVVQSAKICVLFKLRLRSARFKVLLLFTWSFVEYK